MSERTSSRIAAAILAVTVACELAEEPGVALQSRDCPTWKCGFNAAEVNGHSLAELNLDGVANADGARIVGFVPPPLRFGYVLDVDGDELVARKGGQVLRGAQMIGAILLVRLPGGLTIPVTILGQEKVDSWAAGRPPITAYALVYPEPQELLGVKNVCTGSLLDPLANVATVLGGERYDQATKTVVSSPRWLTLACAGSAAAKLALLGYGPQSSATTVDQRQATLKMITADYCGDGESGTANGTPIQWENHDGSVSLGAGEAPGPVEAVWTEDGALCLEATRLAGFEAGCELPACAGLDLDDGEWRTRVPQ